MKIVLSDCAIEGLAIAPPHGRRAFQKRRRAGTYGVHVGDSFSPSPMISIVFEDVIPHLK
jgi:hypothetical protein